MNPLGVAVLGGPLPDERCHQVLAPFPGDPPEQCDADADHLGADGLPYCWLHDYEEWDGP